MYFLRTLVFSAVLCASGTFAAILPVGAYAEGNTIEISIKVHHELPIPNDAGVGVSEKLVFQ
jgi:hypothetical protein